MQSDSDLIQVMTEIRPRSLNYGCNTEHSRVSRVASILLAAWIAFVGVPGLACASAADDCCPDGEAGRCAEKGPLADPRAEAACCAEAPVPVQATSYSYSRVDQAAVNHSGWDEPSNAPFSVNAPAQAAARNERPFTHAASHARDASLTYLRTQRLRL